MTSNIKNDYVNSKALEVKLPNVLENIYKLDHERFINGKLSFDEVKRTFGRNTKLLDTKDEGYRISITDIDVSSGIGSIFYPPCYGVTMSALVLNYQEILGMNDPHTNAPQIIEDALYANTPGGFDPKLDCHNTQDVVRSILNDPLISGSPFADFSIKLNYLNTLLGLDGDTYQELYSYTSNDITVVNDVYDVLLNDSNLGGCADQDCGLDMVVRAYIQLYKESSPNLPTTSLNTIRDNVLDFYCSSYGNCILQTVGPEEINLMYDVSAYSAKVINDLSALSSHTDWAIQEYQQTNCTNPRIYYNLYGYDGITRCINGELVHTRWIYPFGEEESWVYDNANSTWSSYTPPATHQDVFLAIINAMAESGHLALDCAGLVPALGELADGINAVWYFAEGDYVNGALSTAAMLPFLGSAPTFSRWTRNSMQLVRRGSDDLWESPKGLKYIINYNGNSNASRLNHVLSHASPDPTKLKHGVFDDANDIFGTIDDGWEKVLNSSSDVIGNTLQANGNRRITIEMGIRVGTESGTTNTGMALTKIQIIIKDGTDDVVSAYPAQSH